MPTPHESATQDAGPSPVPCATVLKHILCRVAPEDRAPFGAGQRAWQGLAACAGFRGQTGGWSLDDPDRAVILGFWSGPEAADAFQAGDHDRLYAASGQQERIQDLQVTRWRRTVGNGPGAGEELARVAGRAGGFLRIAEARLLPGRLQHFLDAQREVWDPAMRAAGVLASGLWRSEQDDQRFLSLSLWRSRESERAWRHGPFFECWRASGVEDDCEEVTGRLVPVDPEWRVDWPRT